MDQHLPYGLTEFVCDINEPKFIANSISYDFIDAIGRTVYTGETGKGRKRFPDHHMIHKARNLGAVQIRYIIAKSNRVRRAIETIKIAKADPVLNREPMPSRERVAKAKNVFASALIGDGDKTISSGGLNALAIGLSEPPSMPLDTTSLPRRKPAPVPARNALAWWQRDG